MKLRIVIGDGPIDALGALFGLKELHRTPGLLIEGDAGVRAWSRPGSPTVFLAGQVIGMRTSGMGMKAITAGADELEAVVGHSSGDLLDVLEGRFTVVILQGDGACVLRADRFGRMDVYRQRTGDQEIVATDLSMLPVSRGAVEYDQAALAHALCVFGWRPPKQHTIYKGVSRLGVGQEFRVSRNSLKIVERAFKPLPTGHYTESHLDEYAELLLDAVRVRSSEKGNVVYLSSGWDSTAILACLVKLHGPKKVRAVIGRMRYADRSGVINQIEIDRARGFAEYFGVPLEMAEFDRRNQGPDLFEELTPILRSHQLGSLSALNHWDLANITARTSTGDEAVFAGEISDGAHNLGFSQYLTVFHPSYDFREYADKMGSYLFGPSFHSRFVAGDFADDAVYQFLRSRCGTAVFDELDPRGGTARTRQLLSSLFLRANRVPLWSLDNCRMLTPEGCAAYSNEMESTYLNRAAEEATPETLYAWYLHLYNSFHWQGSTVATIPLTAELHDLNVQLPFWDSRLQGFLSAMPESWGRGLNLNQTKYPLKWALANRIDYPMHLQVGPHSYTYDVNPRFSLGAEVMYASAFTPFFKARLKTRQYRGMLSERIFDSSYIESLVDGYLSGAEIDGSSFGDLVSLCWVTASGTYGKE